MNKPISTAGQLEAIIVLDYLGYEIREYAFLYLECNSLIVKRRYRAVSLATGAEVADEPAIGLIFPRIDTLKDENRKSKRLTP